MTTQLARCKINPDKVQELREWYETLETTRWDETKQTLITENTLTETAFILADSTETYLYVYMEKGEEYKDPTETETNHQINTDHHTVLNNCLAEDEWEFLEKIAHLPNPNR